MMYSSYMQFAILVVLPSLSLAQCDGSFRFANYYGSAMVLQQAPARATVWGFAASAGLDVTVTMGSSNYQTVSEDTAAGSTWTVVLNQESEAGPFVIEATSGTCTLTLDDVLFGDVYICSGQSNMAHVMNNIDDAAPDIADSVNYPDVRTLKTSTILSAVPLYEPSGIAQNWQRPQTGSISSFSALCWLFGRNLNQQLGYPIGLVQAAWGGTRIEAWTSAEALEICFPGGTNSPGGANDPSVLWNGMIHPYLPMSIYGAIWYQGESNQGNFMDYACALPTMINDWRSNWYTQTGNNMDSQFPFGQVQLAPNRNNDVSTGFPDVRWSQTTFQGFTPNTELQRVFTAVAIDLPDFNSPHGTIHPRYKRQIAERMAYGAFEVAYGIPTPYQGPLPTSVSVPGEVVVEFDNGDANLEQRADTGFEVCCANSATDFCPANGVWTVTTISSVGVSSVNLANPCGAQTVTGLRYLWRESPCPLELCALYGVENELPAPPYTMNI